MSVSVGIVAVPERVIDAVSLQKKIIGSKIFFDTNHVGSQFGHLGAMKLYDRKATHHLVLQEDVGLCPNFGNELIASIEAVPDKIITYYSGQYAKAGYHWAVKNGYNWYVDYLSPSGQSHLFPRDVLVEFISWCENCKMPFTNEEQYLMSFMVKHGLECWNTAPSLVQHLKPSDSVLGFNNKGKVAIDFYDGSQVLDWNKVPIDYPKRYMKGAVFQSMVRNGWMSNDFKLLF